MPAAPRFRRAQSPPPARLQHRIRVAARPVRPFIEHALSACHTHTPGRTHTEPHGPKPHRIWPPHQIRRETDKRGLLARGSKRRCPASPPCQRERRRKWTVGPLVMSAGTDPLLTSACHVACSGAAACHCYVFLFSEILLLIL
jgi:hypothetical protein